MSAIAAVEFCGVERKFGDFIANKNLSFSVSAGSIHAIVGENGAGKSTAMKLLYGILPPTTGEIKIHGKSVHWKSPSDAIGAGIGMVHQHFMLGGPYSVLDNIILGAEPEKRSLLGKVFGQIDRKSARAELSALASSLKLDLDWDQPIETLPVGVQQRIEILKLLYRKAEILILDEPTAVLTPQERDELFEYLRSLRAQGKTILIITHKLKEVLALSDAVTVFRRGQVTGNVKTAETTETALAEMMVGRHVDLKIQGIKKPEPGESVLEVSDLHWRGRLKGLSIKVRSGEIVGIAGVEGNGQSDLLRLLGDPRRIKRQYGFQGSVKVMGNEVSRWTPSKIRDLGVAWIPEDRHAQGLLLQSTNEENFILGRERSKEFSQSGWLLRSQIRQMAIKAIEDFDVRPREVDFVSGRMSGGNQQKLIIARELGRHPKVVIAAQPTRGVDIGAIEFIHKKLVEVRDGGAGALVISSELDEVMALADRVLVIFEGEIVAEFERGATDERTLGRFMGGGEAHV